MDDILLLCLFVCPLVFLGGFVDSVAGGGGLITLPAYLIGGLPVHVAAGTNKLVSFVGTFTAAVQYFRSGKIKLRVVIPAALGALASSAAGAQLAVHLSERVLQGVMLLALPAVAVFLALRRDLGKEKEPHSAPETASPGRETAVSAAIGLIIGIYDGMVGPGTGTFMIMAFSAFLSLDLIIASGCAKAVNCASNIAALSVYLLNGKILWAIVIPAAVCNALGGLCGARYAIRGGSRRVRSMIFVVLLMLFVKIIYDLISAA